MKRILVPVDFSENSQSALNAARLIARKANAKIYLLHAYVPFVPTEINVPVNFDLYTDLEASLKSNLDGYLQDLQADGLDAEAIWETGPVLKAVVHHTKDLNADLVVIGRTGKGGFLDKLFGSVATDIVRELECVPVLTIPPDAVLAKVDKMVYATRLEFDEDDAIRKIIAISRSLGSKLQLLKLNSEIQPDIQPDHQFIEPLKSEFGFTDEDFVISDIGRNSIVDELENQAVKLQADVLVVSSKERTFIEELLVDPSVSKRLLLNIKIPLIIYRLAGYSYSN